MILEREKLDEAIRTMTSTLIHPTKLPHSQSAPTPTTRHLAPSKTQAEQPSSPLRRVEWLAALLDLSPCQTYDAIASKQVPDDCVVRIGRRLRIIEARVNDWLGLAS